MGKAKLAASLGGAAAASHHRSSGSEPRHALPYSPAGRGNGERTRKRVLAPVFNSIDYDGRVQRAAEALGDRFEVTVLSIDSGNGYRNPTFRSRVIALPATATGRRRRHLYFWLRLWLAALRERPDLVHAHDFYLAFPGWVAARLAGAKLLYDAHELIIPADGPLESRRDRFFYYLERWVVKRADRVIAANPERAELMRQHYRLRELPLVVRNIPPAPAAVPDATAILARYPALQRRTGSIRLVYQGDVDLARGLGPFISAMRHLDERFELVLVGGGADLDAVRRQSGAEGTNGRVILLGKVPRDDLHGILGLADIGIIAYAMKGLNNIYCASNKLFEYAQAGLPMIATCQPPLRSALLTHGIGLVVGCETPESESLVAEIADGVRHLADHLDGYRARFPEFLRQHCWETERDLLVSAVSELCT